MRPIKFRGLMTKEYADTVNSGRRIWLEGYFVRELLGSAIHPVITDGAISVPVDHDTVGQYTGKIDASGKEIYEGDIVNVIWSKGKIPMHVLFHEGEWVLNEYEDDTYHSLYDFKSEELEVIGNIFDNIILLKEEDYEGN